MCMQKRIFPNTSWKFWLSLKSSKEPESEFTSNYQQLNYNWAAQNGYSLCNPSYLLSKMKRTRELCGYPRLKTFDSDSSHFPEEKVMQDVYQQIEQDTKALIALAEHADSLMVSADRLKPWTQGHGEHRRELVTPHHLRCFR